MDAAQVAAFAAALAALPINAFLIIVIVMLWRRLNAVTDLLMDAKPLKTDDSDKLQQSAPAAPAGPADTLPAK